MAHPRHGHPCQRAHRGGNIRDHEGVRGETIRRQGAAGVEAEPSEPKQAGAQNRHRQVMRVSAALPKTDPRTKHQRSNHRRDTGRDVDHRAAGKIERAILEQPATAPNPVRQWRVDQRRPCQHENRERLEALSFSERAGNQRWSDRGEHHLETDKPHHRNSGSFEHVIRGDALSPIVEPADDAALVGAERQRVAPEHPDHADERKCEDAVHDCRKHVLAVHETAVEEPQRRCHQHHQRRGNEKPGGIPTVHDRHLRSKPCDAAYSRAICAVRTTVRWTALSMGPLVL